MSALPLAPILSRVARSFALSLRLLPRETREPTAVAYLLARAADTVADTRLIPAGERAALLERLRAVFAGGAELAPLLPLLRRVEADPDVTAEERALLLELPACLALLHVQPAPEQALIRGVLETLTGGMVLDLQRFPGERAEDLRALHEPGELLDYTYRVAGCVGEFWSDLHRLRLRSCRRIDAATWRSEGVHLGRALQLTNVLRDVARDLRHGRCYLPAGELAQVGLAPADLLDPGRWPALRPVYERWLGRALAEAQVGLGHVLRTPAREPLLRLAGLLPLLLALETLGLVWRGNPLDPTARRKVPRRAVYGALLRAGLAAREDRALVGLYRHTLRRAGLAPLGGVPPLPR